MSIPKIHGCDLKSLLWIGSPREGILLLSLPALKRARGRVVSFHNSGRRRGAVSFPQLHFPNGQMLETGGWSIPSSNRGLEASERLPGETTLACVCAARTLGGSRAGTTLACDVTEPRQALRCGKIPALEPDRLASSVCSGASCGQNFPVKEEYQ